MAVHETQLRLDLLGPPQVCLGDRSLTFPTRKTLALLIYLALEGGQQPRDLLAALLWPESNQERSYASLRNTLGHLRSALSEARELARSSYLSVTHSALALNPDADILVDLKMVERAYVQARADRSSRSTPEDAASLPLLQEAASYHRGDFMAGFSLGDAPDFDDWVDIQREVWRRRLGLILDRLSEIQFTRGDFGDTAETASLWISLDALNEVAYRRKMRAHFAAGERGQALETYDACRAILAAELSVDPEPDTEALANRIRSQHSLQHFEPRPSRIDTPVAFLGNLFSGRTVEHQALVDHYERAAAGRLQVVMLRGEAGIGKTLLAQKFLAWAVGQGAEVLEGHAFESSYRMSYQPLFEMLRPLLAREDMPVDLLGEVRLAPLSYLLPELREHYPEFPAAYLEVDGGRTQLFESLVHLTLLLSGRSPVMLFVDDLQWVDSATLDWLVYAIRRWQDSGVRIMLLVSLRSEALQPPAQLQLPNLINWLAQVEREAVPFHLQLGLLNEQDTVSMMRSILATPAEDFTQWLFKETRGQPFYLKETLKDLLERGAIHPKRQAAGHWLFEVDAEHDLGKAIRVPSTVRTVILSRLNRLSPNALALLAAGAVLEWRITFERMCAISNVTEDTGLPALDELVSSRLLLEVARSGVSSAYIFTHNMIRDVVYTEAGDARRRLFHHRALDVLGAAGDSAAVLAHHALVAGLAEPAFRYSLAAGQEALRLSVPSEAIAHFERARHLVRDASLPGAAVEPDLHNLYSQLGRAYEQGGRHEQAKAVGGELASLISKQS
ncbi:MAG: AAA family ATPase [Anaerolineae bacterium]|nr:AAA family ATPase [Anaerolineae bacterium]